MPDEQGNIPVYSHVDLSRSIATIECATVMYHDAEPNSIEQDVIRNAIVGCMERAHFSAFRLLRSTMRSYGYGKKEANSLSVRHLTKIAVAHGLTTEEEAHRWIEYRVLLDQANEEFGEQFTASTLRWVPVFANDLKSLLYNCAEATRSLTIELN